MSIVNTLYKIRNYLTILLLSSVCFSSIELIWTKDDFTLFFEKVSSFLSYINIILVLCLITIEVISLIKKIMSKDKSAFVNVAQFIIFILICLCFHYFIYYDRLINYSVIIYFSRYLNFDSLLKTFIITNILYACILVYGNLSGSLMYANNGRGISFGFWHSNGAGLFLFMFFLSLSYFLKGNKLLVTIIGMAIELALLFFIKSRTPFIVVAIFILLVWLEEKYKSMSQFYIKIIEFLFVITPILLTIFTFVMGYLITNKIIIIDGNASCRFIESVSLLKEKGLSIFYRDINGISANHYYMDNGYVNVLFSFGCISYLIITSFQLLTNIAVIKNKNYILGAILFCLYLYNLMENVLTRDLSLIILAYSNSLLANSTNIQSKSIKIFAKKC